MIRYCPEPSVTATRDLSMRAGLEASTVTPGSTAPDASRTVPVREACANTVAGSSETARARTHFVKIRIRLALHRRGSDIDACRAQSFACRIFKLRVAWTDVKRFFEQKNSSVQIDSEFWMGP